jgi:branched-chain amino acid transport system ATP-binding protein
MIAEGETGVTETPILQLASIRAGYGSIDVLHGIDLSLHAGEVFALLGPNGAGKSTTLGVACGAIEPHSGSLFVCGRDVTGVHSDALARAGVCLIPEGRGIFPNLSVAENLRMASFTGVSYRDVLDRAFSQFPRLGERRKQTARSRRNQPSCSSTSSRWASRPSSWRSCTATCAASPPKASRS